MTSQTSTEIIPDHLTCLLDTVFLESKARGIEYVLCFAGNSLVGLRARPMNYPSSHMRLVNDVRHMFAGRTMRYNNGSAISLAVEILDTLRYDHLLFLTGKQQQHAVWASLAEYAAHDLSDPNFIEAVDECPIQLVLPTHRIVGSFAWNNNLGNMTAETTFLHRFP